MICKMLQYSLLFFLLLAASCFGTGGQFIPAEQLDPESNPSIDIAFTRDGRILDLEYGHVVWIEDLNPEELEMLPDSCGDIIISGMLTTGEPVCIPLGEVASVHSGGRNQLRLTYASLLIIPILAASYVLVYAIISNS